MAKKRAITVEEVVANPEGLVARVAGKRPLLEDLLPGPEYAGLRESIAKTGLWRRAGARNDVRISTVPTADGKHEIVAVAAVTRDPGLTQDMIDTIQDFLPQAQRDRPTEIQQYWTIYDQDGAINASVNKLAALLSGGGSYKVKRARKGKKQKATEELQAILDEFTMNVNAAPDDGVVTGARGLKAVTQQAVRQALVEGDWIGRSVWSAHQVGTVGKFSMPMTIQSITMANIVAVAEVAGLGLEAFYWKPPQSIINTLTSPQDKNITKLVKKYVPSDVLSQLKKDGQVWLDPALLLHVKHRGVYSKTYGESYIKPAMFGIAYKRAVEALDLVSIQNLINRLTIVMVGSSDPDSPYSDPTVAHQRAALMQQMFDDPGPAMTIIWEGDDVEVKDVGAHSAVLDLNERHRLADGKIMTATGMSEAILTGVASDGKSSAMAAMVALSATLDELKSQFEQVWTTLGQRIANENDYTDYEILFEFDNTLMIDKSEERNQARNDFLTGAMSIRAFIAASGRDPDAEFNQACIEKGLDPSTALWVEAFAPPQGLPGQGTDAPPGQGGGKAPGSGRTPDSVSGKPAAPPKETKKPTENK